MRNELYTRRDKGRKAGARRNRAFFDYEYMVVKTNKAKRLIADERFRDGLIEAGVI